MRAFLQLLFYLYVLYVHRCNQLRFANYIIINLYDDDADDDDVDDDDDDDDDGVLSQKVTCPVGQTCKAVPAPECASRWGCPRYLEQCTG